MIIAKVIVDVPAMQTDRPFDYIVPEDYHDLVQPGIRVIVPFGPRNVQGFIVGLEPYTGERKLKPIHKLLDVEPILNGELLQLGKWLTEQTLSYRISSFQAMLPAALKAKYEKEIILKNPNQISLLAPSLQHLFQKDNRIHWNQIEDQTDLIRAIQNEIKNGLIEVDYVVKARAKKKTHRVLSINITKEQVIQFVDSLPPQASR
jgi:primosomal protein N' (replication factor Y)